MPQGPADGAGALGYRTGAATAERPSAKLLLVAAGLLLLVKKGATFSRLKLCHRAKAPDVHDFRAKSLFGRENRRDDFYYAAKLILLVDVRGEETFARRAEREARNNAFPKRGARGSCSARGFARYR